MYLNPLAETVSLNPMGFISGDCQETKLFGSIGRIKASWSEDIGVHIIRYYNGESSSTYGNIGDENVLWYFNTEEPFVGVYGNYSVERGIEKLGFISLDT